MKTFPNSAVKLEHWIIAWSVFGLTKWIDPLNHKAEYRFLGKTIIPAKDIHK